LLIGRHAHSEGLSEKIINPFSPQSVHELMLVYRV
jgi:hypothetical protein